MSEEEIEGEAPKPRKPYEKPRVTQVELRPQEAILANCKISGTSGPATADCGTFVCSSVGS